MSKNAQLPWRRPGPRATRKRMMARVEELGCTVDWGSTHTMIIDAPKYHIFGSTLTSSLWIDYADLYGGESWKPQAYALAIDDMGMGIIYDPLYDGSAWWDDPDDAELAKLRAATQEVV